MIKRLVLHNFLSHENSEIVMDGVNIISVIGEVGSGKSALLESIYYVLYGEGRTNSLKQLVTRNKEEMSVTMDLEINGNSYIIKRGIKSLGAGYISIIKNGEETESAGKALSEEWINDTLGMNLDMFLLTSYFGTGESDKLLKTTPSERLETIQKIVKADQYFEYYEIVNKRIKVIKNKIEVLEDIIEARKLDKKDFNDFEIKKDDKEKELIKIKNKLDELNLEKNDLQIERNKFKICLQEKAKTDQEIKDCNELIITHEDDNEEMIENKEKDVNDIKKLKLKEKELIELLKNKDIVKYEEEKINYIKKIESNESMKRLYDTALNIPEGEELICPLCRNEISDSNINEWVDEAVNIEKSVKASHILIKKLESEIFSIRENKKHLLKVQEELEDIIYRCGEYDSKINKNNIKINNYKGKLESLKSRIKILKDILKSYPFIESEIERVESEIRNRQKSIGSLLSDINNIKEDMKEEKIKKLEIDKKRKEINNYRKILQALDILSNAWSRYGIPYELTENLKQELSKEATELLSYFMDGEVSIEDIEERGKPGIEFYLNDLGYKRAYKELSTGQKVILGLCIRCAISMILRREVNTQIDFLILDEVAGNLDSNKKDELVLLIKKILSKHYKQIFVVSHNKLKDIFDRTFEIVLENGVSYVRES